MAIEINLRVLIAQKEQAEKIKLSYREIAEQTGLSTSTIFLLHNNRAKMINLRTLDILCNFFQVSPEKILLWTPDEKEV